MANDKKKRREEEEQIAKGNYAGSNVRVIPEAPKKVVRNYGIKPLHQRIKEKKDMALGMSVQMIRDRTSFVEDSMNGGIQYAMQNQQKRQNKRAMDAALEGIRNGSITMDNIGINWKEAPEIVAPGYGWKQAGNIAVYATPGNPLPDPKKAKTATRAQAPGAFGVTPQEYSAGMKAIRDLDAFGKREKPQAATYDTLENEGAKKFIDKWFPEKQGQLPTQDEMFEKWAQLEPWQQGMYELDQQTYGPVIEDHRALADDDMRLYEEEREKAQAARDAAIERLGEDAPAYAYETKRDMYGRFANTYGMSEAAKAYEKEYKMPGVFGDYDEHDATMYMIQHPEHRQGLERYEGTENETGYSIFNREMTDDQKTKYMAIAGVYGEEAAQDWLKNELTEGRYNERAYWTRDEALRAGANEDWLAATGKSILNAPLQLMGTAYGIQQGLKGEEIDPYNNAFRFNQAVQTPRDEVQQMITENFGTKDESGMPKDTFMSWLMKSGYNAGTSGGDSMMAMPFSFLLPGGGALMQGLWGASGQIQDATMRGAGTAEALLAGGISAVIETATEYLPMDHLIKTLDNKDIRSFKDIIVNAAKGGFLGAPGEGLSELLGYISDDIIMGEMSNWDALVAEKGALGAAKQVAWDVFNSTFVGWLSESATTTVAGTKAAAQNAWNARGADANIQQGAPMQQPEPVQQPVQQKQQQEQAEEDPWDVPDEPIAEEQQTAETPVNADGSNPLRAEREVTGKRPESVQESTTEEQQAETETVSENGSNPLRAEREVTGRRPESVQESTTEEQQAETEAVSEDGSNPLRQERKVTDKSAKNAQAAGEDAHQTAPEAKAEEQQPKEEKPAKTAENAKGGNPLRQEREVTVRRGNVQQQMTVTGVETVNGGNVFLSVKNEDGDAEVVSAADVEFADPAMNELAASPQLTRMDGKTASVFLEGYDAKLATPQEYAQAFESAYQDGKAGLEYERMMQHDQQAMKYLPRNVRKMAYTRGAAALIQKYGDKYRKGGVVKHYSGAAWRQMTGEQKKRARANMELANVIGRRMGKAIEVVDEIVVGGEKANAMYDRRTGTIRVALDADAQAYAYVAMHELTHALKNEHAEEYHALENFVAEALDRKGQSLADLMDEQIERYGLKPEEALEEVICNTVPALLRDEQNVMELYKGNRTLFERVMDWVRQLLDDVNATGDMLSKGSADWAQMDVLKDSREDLQKMLEIMERAFDSEKQNDEINTLSPAQLEQAAIEGAVPNVMEAPVEANGKELKYSRSTYEQPMAKDMPEHKAKKLGVNYEIRRTGANGRKAVYASGRDVTAAVMKKEGFSQRVIDKAVGYLDTVSEWFEKAVGKYEYVNLQDVNDASIMIDHNTGKITFSCMVPNAEYKVNFDFTTVCRQREAVQRFVDDLAKTEGKKGGTKLDEISLTPENIFKLNTILKDEGYETACLGCFVEAKRYRIKEQADTLVREWNDLVLAKNPNAEYFDFATGETDLFKMSAEEINKLEANMRSYSTKGTSRATERAERLVEVPEMQKLIRPGDFISRQGRKAIREFSPALESFLVSRFGQAGAKPAVGFMPYNSEVALLPDTKNVKGKRMTIQQYLAQMGGARSNSFSDFLAAHAMDYLQRTVDLAARKATAQCYTKVPGRAMLFGRMGEKVNMSVMFDIDPKLHWSVAGLDANGEYIVGDKVRAQRVQDETGTRPFTQSFPWDKAVEIEHDARYAENSGIIGVGYSYNHMVKMMQDENVPYIIGYHRSNLPENVAKASNTSHATNYEPVQNTTRLNGYAKVRNMDEANGVPSYATWPEGKKKTEKSSMTWDMQDALKRNGGNATAAMTEWLAWMKENDLTPITSAGEAGHGAFDLYGSLAKTMDPAQTAEEYAQYCLAKGELPVFYEFMDVEGYDKVLFDFSVRNLATGEVALQKPVSFDFLDNMPVEEFIGILEGEMDEHNRYNQEQFDSEKWERVKQQAYEQMQKPEEDLTPTDDQRMKFSRKGLKEGVEETRDLIAVHNLTEDKLLKVIHRGGFVMPSIAIVNNKSGHDEFGDFTVVFDKTTVDPKKTRKNEIFSGNAYTPMFPEEADELSNRKVLGMMKKQRKKAASKKDIRGALVEEYKSIEEVKANQKKLYKEYGEDEQIEYSNQAYGTHVRFEDIAMAFAGDGELQKARDILVDAVAESKTKEEIYRKIKKYSRDFNPTEKIAEELYGLMKMWREYGQQPYFEAKPRRIVGIDEVRAMIAPDNMSETLREKLEEEGVNLIEYKAGDENDRVAKMNSEEVSGLRFSRKGLDPAIDEELEHTRDAFELVRHTHRITAAEADQLAGKILKEANSTYDRQELANELAGIFDYIERADTVDMDHVDDMQTRLMAKVMGKSQVLDTEHEEQVQPIRDYFKKHSVRLSDDQRSEAANIMGSYAAYRRSLMGRVKLVNDSKLGLEDAWRDLADITQNPEWFPEDVNAMDLPGMLLDLVEAMKPVYNTPQGAEDAASWLAGKMNEAYLKLPAVQAGAKSRTQLGTSVKEMRKALTRFAEASGEAFGDVLAQLERTRKKNKDESDREAWAEIRRQYDEWKAQDADKREERFQLELKNAKDKLTANDLAMRMVYAKIMAESYKRQRRKDMAEMREREALRKQRGRTEATVRTLMNWMDKPTDAKHVPAGLDEPLKNLLTALDFGGKDTKAAKSLSNRLELMATALEAAQEQEDESRTMFIERDQQMVDELRRVAQLIKGNTDGRTVYELNSMELKDLNKWLGAVKHVITQASKMHGTNLGDVQQVAAESIQEIAGKKPMKDKKWITKQWESLFGPDMMDSFTFFERLGPTSERVFKELRKGFDRTVQLTRDAEKATKEMLKDIDLKKLSGRKAEKLKVDVRGRTVEMTRANIMELYVLNKRKQAQGHLYGGGFRIKGDEDAHPLLVTSEDVKRITDLLTEKEKQIADAMQEYLSKECAAWGNETSMKLLGYEKFGEETYWPITTDSNERSTTKLEENFAANISAIKNQGMTKQLIEGASNAIIIGDIFDTYTQHISNMSAYAGYAVPLSDMQKWLNSRGLKTEIEHVMGAKGKAYINNFLMAVNGTAARTPLTGLEKATKVFSRNAKTAAVGANIRVIVQQPTSYARAAMYMNAEYLTRALASKKPEAELVNKWCSIAAWKRYGFRETNVGPGLREMIVGDTSTLNKLKSGAMKPAEWGDNWTLNHLWAACELETQDVYPELKVGTDEYYQKVGERMSEIVDRTQVVDSPFHKSQIMRSKNMMAQMLTNFMAEPTKTFNMLTSAIYAYADNRKNPAARARVAKAVAVWAVSGALTAAASAVVDAIRNDDEEKEWIEKYKEAALGNTLDNLNPLGMLPGIKDVLSIMEGYDPSRIDQQSIQKFKWAYDEVVKYANGESKLSRYGVIYKIAQALSSVTGVPLSNAMRELNAVWQSVTGVNPTLNEKARKGNTIDTLYETMQASGEAKTAKEKDAATKKITEAREKLKKIGMNPKEIDTAIAERLAEDERIRQAWEAKQEKRVGDVNRTKNALAKEGFTGEMVDKAIIEYGKSVTPKEEKEKDMDAQLKAKLFTQDEAVAAIRAGASVDDIKYLMSELVSDSKAKDPGESVRKELVSEIKKDYMAAVSKGDKAGEDRVRGILMDALGVKEEELTAWTREQHTADLKTAMDAFDTKAALKAVGVMRADGKTDSQIETSLAKYRHTYVEAYERGDMKTANKVKTLLMSLGLKGTNGKPLYDEDTFVYWLK